MFYEHECNCLTSQGYDIPIINSLTELLSLNTAYPVHILASGNSMTKVDMIKVITQPCVFVNGSVQLFNDFEFTMPVAYIISDHRFIEHNLNLMEQYYHGQCSLYITQAVLENLKKLAPDYLRKIQTHIRLIYNFQKPIVQKKSGLLDKIIKKRQNIEFNDEFIKLKPNTHKPTVGVSVDIRHGFVEAGTVAFVATQLACTLGFKQIYLHGMDLLNANQPRFYENQTNQAPCKLDKAIANRIVPSFDFLVEIYQQVGVLVYNGSPVSKGLFSNLAFQSDYLL